MKNWVISAFFFAFSIGAASAAPVTVTVRDTNILINPPQGFVQIHDFDTEMEVRRGFVATEIDVLAIFQWHEYVSDGKPTSREATVVFWALKEAGYGKESPLDLFFTRRETDKKRETYTINGNAFGYFIQFSQAIEGGAILRLNDRLVGFSIVGPASNDWKNWMRSTVATWSDNLLQDNPNKLGIGLIADELHKTMTAETWEVLARNPYLGQRGPLAYNAGGLVLPLILVVLFLKWPQRKYILIMAALFGALICINVATNTVRSTSLNISLGEMLVFGFLGASVIFPFLVIRGPTLWNTIITIPFLMVSLPLYMVVANILYIVLLGALFSPFAPLLQTFSQPSFSYTLGALIAETMMIALILGLLLAVGRLTAWGITSIRARLKSVPNQT